MFQLDPELFLHSTYYISKLLFTVHSQVELQLGKSSP